MFSIYLNDFQDSFARMVKDYRVRFLAEEEENEECEGARSSQPEGDGPRPDQKSAP